MERAMANGNINMAGKSVAISGSGNVALYCAEKCIMYGSKVLSFSDSNGVIINKNGFSQSDIQVLKHEKFNL